MKRQKVLPPLDYLLAFEAAALHGSFAQAARNLNISETSISRKVRLLELHFDVPLFVRGHRSITLTPHGRSLLDPVTQSLDTLRTASQDMFSKQQKNSVTLAATNSVATLWLMPRMHRFTKANPRVKINLVASDNDLECLAETVDIAILRGTGDWPGFTANRLFGETVFPVCAPGYLRQNPALNTIDDLAHHDLIQVSSLHSEWITWDSWLRDQGQSDVSIEGGVHFNTYPLALQGAIDGLGVALGWGHLADRLLDSGQLVRPLGDTQLRTSDGYYLLSREVHKSFPERGIVENWLLKESAARKRYAPRTEVGPAAAQNSDEAV